MSYFEDAYQHVLKVEGGFVNNLQDRGGPTKYGVTMKTLKSYQESTGDSKEVTAAEVRMLSQEKAKIIYKKLYWDQLNLDSCADRVLAIILFDQAINRGCRSTLVNFQMVCGLVPDGTMGPRTEYELSRENLDRKRALAVIKYAQLSYVRIVSVTPSQIIFLAGWLNRTHFLMDLLLE